MAGMYSWTKQGAGGRNKRNFRRKIGTGGGEKNCFAVQLTVAKDGTKLKPYVIFKGASFNSIGEHRRRTIAHELFHRLEDNAGNSYPPEEKNIFNIQQVG